MTQVRVFSVCESCSTPWIAPNRGVRLAGFHRDAPVNYTVFDVSSAFFSGAEMMSRASKTARNCIPPASRYARINFRMVAKPCPSRSLESRIARESRANPEVICPGRKLDLRDGVVCGESVVRCHSPDWIPRLRERSRRNQL
jgi:hypothetical protein